MKFIVTATSINRYDNYSMNAIREEEIDTEENDLFEGCTTCYQVEDRYEHHWNRLNGDYINNEIVKVLLVEQVHGGDFD